MSLFHAMFPRLSALLTPQFYFGYLIELESSLQIGDTYTYDDDDGWKPDSGGNLLLYEKEVIVNKGYLKDQPKAKPARVKYCDWVASNAPGRTVSRVWSFSFAPFIT